MCLSVVPHGYPRDIHVNQAAKDMSASYDALVNMLESIEHLLRRLGVYVQIPHTPALDERVVKTMMELLSTLALATKELKQGRLSKSALVEVLLYSIQYSRIINQNVWREGCRGSTA
jgi:hypothetical protein